MARKTPTTDAVKIVHGRYYAKSLTRALQLEFARLNAAIAREIYALRKKAGLTQQQLAELVGTKGSVISRLKDDDYAGHSLRMLQRISAALNCRVEIRFLPARAHTRVASG
jgi:DNA-binding XRE family transcriptional regulator